MNKRFFRKNWVITFITVAILILVSKLAIYNNFLNIVAVPALFATTILSIPVRIFTYLFIPGESNIFQTHFEYFNKLTIFGEITVIVFWSAFSAFIGWAKKKIKRVKS